MLIKKIAKAVLKDEIKSMKDNIDYFREKSNEIKKELDCAKSKNSICEREKAQIEMECERLKRENEILRMYYDLDSDPSEEIKMKMHIDIELNRVKEENMALRIANLTNPIFMPQPYPVFYGGRFW